MALVDRRLLYAGLLVAAGVGLVRAFRGPRIEPGQTRLLLVGDSLAVGLATPMRALAAEANVPFDQISRSGTRIDQWAGSQKLAEKIQNFNPTMVLVSLGTNDEYMGAGAAARQAPHLERLLVALRANQAEVIWIGPPRLPKPSSNGIVPLLRKTIARDHYFPSEKLTIPRGPDGLHPTARGYAGWAGAIWRWLS
jgi:lysophospholipase L1-like esterase